MQPHSIELLKLRANNTNFDGIEPETRKTEVLQPLNHLDAAYNLARWMTHNEHDAEDIMQNAYLRAIRHFGSFQEAKARLGCWPSYAIAVTIPHNISAFANGLPYEGDVRQTLTLQRQVARAIAEQIHVELTLHERDVLKSEKAVNAEAYEDYLKWRYAWNKRTADGLKKAIDFFNHAIEKDPTCAQAYSGLADAYAFLGVWSSTSKEAYPRAKAVATKAFFFRRHLQRETTFSWMIEPIAK